jgi:hypothetical protein
MQEADAAPLQLVPLSWIRPKKNHLFFFFTYLAFGFPILLFIT